MRARQTTRDVARYIRLAYAGAGDFAREAGRRIAADAKSHRRAVKVVALIAIGSVVVVLAFAVGMGEVAKGIGGAVLEQVFVAAGRRFGLGPEAEQFAREVEGK